MTHSIKLSSSISGVARTIIVSSALAIGLALSSPVSAASQCKGLDSNACSTSASCSWVEGYERKDGRKVNAFCRAKAKRTSTAVKPAANTKQAQPGK